MLLSKNEMVSLVKKYTRDMFTYAYGKVKQKEIAEDLVQDAFLSAFQTYEKFKGTSNIKTWLFAILKHKIADHFRLKYKENVEVFSKNTGDFFDNNARWKDEYKPTEWKHEKELLDDTEFSKTLNNCLDKLPEKWSAVVHLKFLEDNNSKNICASLQISDSNFWQIIHRAKLQLRNCLQINWFNKN